MVATAIDEASVFDNEPGVHMTFGGEVSDDFLREMIRQLDASGNRIQGFLYGKIRVIRDVWKPPYEQRIWWAKVADCTDEEFAERCQMERLRIVLKNLSTERRSHAPVNPSNTDTSPKSEPSPREDIEVSG